MNICIHGKVLAEDGISVGIIHSIIFNPHLGEVTHLVVHKGIFLAHDTLVPMSMVQGNKNDELLLHIASDEIRTLPVYNEGMFRKGPAGSEEVVETPEGERFGVEEPADRADQLRRAIHIEPGSVEITRGTEVEALDGKLGSLACLQLDQYTNHLSYVVVAKGPMTPKETSVPAEWVSGVSGDKISLSVPIQQAIQGPPPPAGPYLPVEPTEEELHH